MHLEPFSIVTVLTANNRNLLVTESQLSLKTKAEQLVCFPRLRITGCYLTQMTTVNIVSQQHFEDSNQQT
jgi:hypothetical protein